MLLVGFMKTEKAKDVASWIDYTGRTGQLLNIIDEDEKLTYVIHNSGQNREMWFLTEDVASWIEHSDISKMLKGIDEEEKVKNIIPTLGGNQEMSDEDSIINQLSIIKLI